MRVARFGQDGLPDGNGRTDTYDYDLESKPPMKTPPPVKRLDGALAQRLVTVAKQFLSADATQRLDEHDRTLMCGEVLARRGAVVERERSDVYVAERYRLLFESVRTDGAHVGSWEPNGNGATDPYAPADGMAAGSVVGAEVKGNAKLQRTREYAYLNVARTQLTAEANGRNTLISGRDVEDRATVLAKTDPLGLFSK